MKLKVFAFAMMFCLVSCFSLMADELAEKLQDVSVTIATPTGEGSGVLITREVETENGEKQTINFVWTAAHVVDGLRSTRTIIVDGKQETLVEFRDAQVIKELIERGRKVGELRMSAKVLKYSDATNGEDLALLMLRKHSFINNDVEFVLDKDNPVPIGTRLFHVGSLLGQQGSNSMTDGIVSQIGRVLQLGSGEGTVFDQTTVNAFPGSSGGGVFLGEKFEDYEPGTYMGMLVRGAGETFNLVVPARRMQEYCERNCIMWAMDKSVPMPKYDTLMKIPVEQEHEGECEVE